MTQVEVRDLGAPISATALYSGSPAACNGPTDFSASFAAFAVGPVVAPSQFVEMTEIVE